MLYTMFVVVKADQCYLIMVLIALETHKKIGGKIYYG